MSLYRIALAAFLVITGVMFLFGLGRTWQVIDGIAALVAGVILFLERDISTPR